MRNVVGMLFFLICSNLPAGDAAGHVGGTLARLLAYSKSEIVNMLPLLNPSAIEFQTLAMKKWYAASYGKMLTEIKSLRFKITSGTLRDSSFGYETWIRVRQTTDFVVEYSPDIENYQRLVGIINPEYRHSGRIETSPSISDVSEYLLHEIGHRYGLGEQDAWTFAQTLAANFKFNKPLKPRNCRVRHFGQTGDALDLIEIRVTTEFQSTHAGNYFLDYKLDSNNFLFEFEVYDSIHSNRFFYINTSADSWINSASDRSTGWGIACDNY